MNTDLSGMYERLDDRASRSNRILSDAYQCQQGAFAIVEEIGVDPGMIPDEIMEDVAAAFEQLYLPILKKQLEVEADYVPDIDLFHGTVMMAAAFGAEIKFPPNEWPWALPSIHSIREVDHLEAPDLTKSPSVENFFDQVRWLQDRPGGRVPVKLMDLQSPFTTACQLRGTEEVMLDLIDDPARVKKLLAIITGASIEFLELQEQVFTNPSYPGRNFPCVLDDLGICVADDTPAIMLSPAMYAEFALPTLLKIAETVPGLFIHCCGDYNHQMDNLLQVPTLRAVQMHTGPDEIDSLPSWRKMRGRVALYSDTNHIGLGDEYAERYWDCYEEYVLPRLLEAELAGLVLLSPPAETREERRANVHRLRDILARKAGEGCGAQKNRPYEPNPAIFGGSD